MNDSHIDTDIEHDIERELNGVKVAIDDLTFEDNINLAILHLKEASQHLDDFLAGRDCPTVKTDHANIRIHLQEILKKWTPSLGVSP